MRGAVRQHQVRAITLAVVIVATLVAIPLWGLMVLSLPLTTKVSLASEGHTSDSPDDLEVSVDFIQIGLAGGIEADVLVTELVGEKAVLLGTSKGLYIISEGGLQRYIPTPSSVSDIALLEDVTGDGQQEIVVAIDDIYFPNIRCYEGDSGEKIWHFVPKQDAFVDNLLWTELQTSTFDVEAIADVNSDGYQDIAATSGYCLYLLDGRTGEQIWRFETEDNLWQVSILPDIDGDGIEDLAVGAQTGFVYVLSGEKGNLIWESRIAEECVVFDEKGGKWATVDRSVWDIVTLMVDGKEKAVVSSEDGKVRLVSLEDGSYDWETSPLIEYSASLLYEYYRRKNKLPTSPGDLNFFNLRISLIEDVSGDDVGDVLASAYTGQGGGEGGYIANSGLFMINSASGDIIWQEMTPSLGSVARVETASIDEQQVILLPQEKDGSTAKVQVASIEDGQAIETLEIVSSQSSGSSGYWVKGFDEDCFVLVSDYDDLLCVSSEGDVLWHYPRISDVAVERGEFTGDDTPDLFIWSKHRLSGWGNEFGARILYVIDGATRSKAWSYEIPYEDLADIEGIANILVTPDLNGDGKQDVAGYVQPRSPGEYGEGFKIMAFSGSNGAVLLDQPVVTETYYGIYEQLYEAKDSSPQAFNSFVNGTLTKGVQAAYYDVYEGLDEKPFLKRLVDDFVQQILDERGEYDPGWLNQPEWVEDLNRCLEEWRQQKRIDKRIVSLDSINTQGDMAFIVGCRRDMFVISPEGELLRTETENPWVYEDPFCRVQPEGMRAVGGWETRYRSLGDINSDGVDDLLVAGHGFVRAVTSVWEEGDLKFEAARTLYDSEGSSTEGVDPGRVSLVDDMDGDDIKEAVFFKWRENQPELLLIVSPASGDVLLEREWHGGGDQAGGPLSSADFNNDGYVDGILFSRWRPGFDRPMAEVISGKDGGVLWLFDEFSECWLFDSVNLQQLMPATAMSDLNGDGIADLALIKFLHDQPGARVGIYDVAHNELLKEIIIEKFDERVRWERRWHPGACIEEIGDCNGDGVKELAVLTMMSESGGQTEEGKSAQKEVQLIVVDVVSERVIAEFEILGSTFVDIGEDTGFGVVGLSGEFYFLNVANSLHITFPSEGDILTSPVTITWGGVSRGAFNQVFVDDAEVARTNENEVIVDVARGEHELVVRSLDEYGRGIYATVTFEVKKGSNVVVVASLALVIAILVAISPVLLRITRSRYGGPRRGQ